MANERVAMAKVREAISAERTELTERWASMCETRTSMIASDANTVLQYATETARCIGLVRKAELRKSALLSSVEQHCMAESRWCEAQCQEAERRVAY